MVLPRSARNVQSIYLAVLVKGEVSLKDGLYTLKEIMLYSKDYRRELLSVLILNPAQYLASTIISAIGFKVLIGGMIDYEFYSVLSGAIIILLALLSSSIFRGLAQFYTAKATVGISHNLRINMLYHLLKVNSVHDEQEHSGQMLMRNDQDTENTAKVLSEYVISIITPIVVSTICLGIVFFTSWQIGIVLILSVILVFTLHMHFAPLYRRAGSMIQESLAVVTGHFSDSLFGAFIIRAFCAQGPMIERIRQSINQLYEDHMEETKLRTKHGALVNILSYSSATIPFVLGSILVARDYMEISNIIFITQLSSNLLWFADGLAQGIADIQKGLSSTERVLEVMDITDENKAYGKLDFIKNTNQCDITLNNVSVRYSERTALDKVNLQLKENHMYAFVGQSGSGKSTLLKVLQQLVPYEGEVLLGGVDAYEFSLKSLRQGMAYVGQEISLFNKSIYDNILYGRSDATEDEIMAVAQSAYVHEFANDLPDKYDTIVGERDMRLSGGQCQRIAIARGLLKNAPIFLFDEVTSALDSQSEDMILKVIESLRGRHTVLISTHKLSTIINVDRIFVLKEGMIVEEGTHDELVTAKGEYQFLINSGILQE